MDTLTGAPQARDLCLELVALPRVVRRTLADGQRFRTPPETMVTVVESGLLCRSSDLEGRARFVTEVFARGAFVEPVPSTEEGGDRSWQIVASIPSSVLQLPSAIFQEECRRIPALGTAAGVAWRRQHEILSERLAILVRRAPLPRVAATLLFLAQRLAVSHNDGSDELPLTQELIAATADMARQTVNRALGEMSDRSILVARRRRISILDMEALRALALGRPPQRPQASGILPIVRFS